MMSNQNIAVRDNQTPVEKSQKMATSITIADLELDSQKNEVRHANQIIHLSPLEFRLLAYFMQNPDIVLSREVILRTVWAYSFQVETRVVDVYVGYLRKKIYNKLEPKRIHSVRGLGYILKIK